ncbi:hypothetical protein [Fontivita pretiosa]|uniref:dockerin type I repeat-containing protein n=1 Tax=Fontivita pretiosa TaxID=2989684 RepID=UPI003D185D01
MKQSLAILACGAFLLGAGTALPQTTTPRAPARTGIVAVDDHALRDDQGHFLGLGVTYMSALHRAKYDRARLRADLEFLSQRGFNYIRALSMVGWYEAWAGKEIAPVTFTNRAGQTVHAWPDYWQQLRDLIDIAYDDYGLRIELTIFADAQLMPTKAARLQHMQTILDNLQGRQHKLILLEVANEAWQNGFPGSQGIADLREFGQYLNARTSIPVALSAPEDYSNDGIAQLYQNSGVDIATVHFSRDIGTIEGGWYPVRDPWRVGFIPDIPPVSSNEPIGPGASVAQETDPIKLVSAAAFAYMAKLPMYVYHTDAGVFGNTRFEDKPGVGSFWHLHRLLAGDIANWTRNDGLEAAAPFTVFANGQPNKYWWQGIANPTSGVSGNLSTIRDDRFYTLPMGILPGGAELQARRDMTFQLFNPLTGQVVLETTKRAGERFTIAQGPQAYIVKGTFAAPAQQAIRIDLGDPNDPNGLVHPQGGDGDTTPLTIAGRTARRNANPAEDFYFYFAAADWFSYQASKPNLLVTVTYLDTGGSGAIQLQYDSNTGDTLPALYKNGGSVALGASGQWKQHTFQLADAYFGNRQNHGADFRVLGPIGSTFYLDHVEVAVASSVGSIWNIDAIGAWSDAGNWAGGVPDGPGATANFGGAITSPRTISLDSPRALGVVRFDDSDAYTISGSSTLTIDATSGNGAINVLSGSHSIAAPIQLADNTTVAVASGQTLSVQHVRGAGLTVSSGTMRVINNPAANSPAGTSRVASLAVGSGARLDLNNNSLIVNSGSLATVTASIKSALENGGNFDWLGPGIGSTQANVQNTAAGSFLYGLGVVLNDLAQVGGSGPIYTTFAGQTLTGNEILVKFTYFGDADLSGSIDATDYSLIDNGYVNTLSGWINGDFDYSGSIDATDYALIDNAYVNQAGPLAEALIAEHARMFGGEYLAALRAVQSGTLPEPAMSGACAAGLLAAKCRLRARN